jgi:aminoglycoside phosphotransferase family enzyme
VDWVVEMRRVPTELTLDALHPRGKLRPEHIDRLAETLVLFYLSLKPLPLTTQQYRERCSSHVRGNLRELLAVKHHLPRGVVERVHGFQIQLLRLRPALFEERVRAGRIVEGHGDLRPEHICLSDPIAIFDCIEFSPASAVLTLPMSWRFWPPNAISWGPNGSGRGYSMLIRSIAAIGHRLG